MTSKLTIEINKLTNAYNNSINILVSQFRENIKIINKYRLSIYVKANLIKLLTINYNKNFKRVTDEYNIKKQQLIQVMSTTNTNANANKNKNALLIGINYINTPSQLYGCINDTSNIKDFLQNKFNYNIFNILTDYTNKIPNKINIINEFTNLLVNANTGDNIFFLYSGHGTCTLDLNNDEIDGIDEMIVPVDATDMNSCILDDEINNIIMKYLKVGVNK